MKMKPAKQPKGKAKAKPAAKRAAAPAPVSFEPLLDGAAEPVRETALHLREIVLSTIAQLKEGVYGHAPVMLALYSMGGPNTLVCGIQPRQDRCLFYLHRIAEADVPELELMGIGTTARHIEFNSPDAVPDDVIRRLVKLSADRLG